MEDKSIIIIGAGFAGLCAGIYAQMNGYRTQIFELHDKPGGLCTAWKRKGYTIDGCIHWLVGSSPKSAMYRLWQEVGLAQGREFINLDEFMRFEGADGRAFTLYCDVDRLEKHMLELSPQDAASTRQFIQGIRLALAFDQPVEKSSPLVKWLKGLKMGLFFALKGKAIQDWMKTTTKEFASRFKDPLIRQGLEFMWLPDFSMFFMLFTLAYLHNKNAGYPIGGSLPMSRALEKRYLALGGTIHYNSRVEKILVDKDASGAAQAVGVLLVEDDSGRPRQHRAARVISAADGYHTIFEMLEGKFVDDKVREPYEKWPIFPPLIYVGMGVKRTFAEESEMISGFSFPLRQPVEIADSVVEHLEVHLFNYDPTLAPEGKTSLTVMLPSNHKYWQELAQDRAAYEEKKDQIARTLVELLEQRFPGFSEQVEMVDVATPLTFERYTGNWQGSFEGWLITPQNAHVVMKPMSQTLPGLQNFYMCGQWVEPGGGLPTGLMSGRRLVQALCKQDGLTFSATVP